MHERPSIPLLLDLMRMAVRKRASAVYVVPWMPPTLRIDEHTVPLSALSFTPEQSSRLVLDLLDDAQRAALNASREIRFSFVREDLGHFRVHAFRRHGQPAMVIKPYALALPSPRSLALPELACSAVMADRGLLLLASRSSALRHDCAAALLEHRHQNGQGELLVLDDASRFWHGPGRCQLRQGLSSGAVDDTLLRRGAHLAPGSAPPGALAIAWGDLLDGAQLERAVRAAEHALCLVTLDAGDPLTVLHRLMTLTAEQDRADLRRRCALALHAVLALRPVPAAAGGHLLAATEALMNSPELAANLAEGDLPALRQMLTPPGAGGGADEHLWQLLQQGLVRADDALKQALDRDGFARRSDRPVVVAAATPDAAIPTATAPVDSGFADLFGPTPPRSADPFDFDQAGRPVVSADTQFEQMDGADDATAPAAVAAPHLARSAQAPPACAQFHAWAPAAVAPGSTVPIDLWVALPAQAAQVAARARLASDLAAASATADEGVPQITLQLHIDGVQLQARSQRLAWKRRPDRVRFAVAVPPHLRPGAHAARVRLSVGGLPVGELSFVLQVMPGAATNAALEDMHPVRRMLQSAYACFAEPERNAVLTCVRPLLQVAPGLDVFVDAAQLRSGEHWRTRIEHEVGRRERLFLFWSAAAAESPWVDFEWRLMLRRGGVGLIDAIPLDPPQRAPLPAELADLLSAEVRPRRAE